MRLRKTENHSKTLENNINISIEFKESLEIYNRKKDLIHYTLYVNGEKVTGGYGYRFEAILVYLKAIHNYQLAK